MESPDHVENSWLTAQACHVVVQMSAPHQFNPDPKVRTVITIRYRFIINGDGSVASGTRR